MLGIITYSAIVAALFIFIWKRPSIALAGVLCMFGLEQLGQASHPFFSQHQAFTNVLIGGILTVAVGIKVLKGERVFEQYPAVGWMVLALFCYALASALWVRRPELTMEIWEGRGPYVLTFLVLTPLVMSSAQDIEAATKAIILIGTTVALFLLIFVSWDARSIVLEGGHGNPLAVSQMAGMVALVAILGNPWERSKMWQVARWAVVAVCLILVIRAGARGQLLGILIVTMVCWPISRRIQNPSQVFLLVGLIGFLAAVTSYGLQEFWAKPSSYYAGGSRWSEQAMHGAMSGRLEQALILVRHWYGSPETILFGLGNSASFDPRVLGMYPHFVPLEILAEEGLMGFLAFLLILFVTWQNVAHCLRAIRDTPSDRPLIAALAAMFLYALLLALKQGSLLNNLELFMFAILIGKYRAFLSMSNPIDSTRRFRIARDHNSLPEYPSLRHATWKLESFKA
jgi:hypothetical protein